MTLMLRRLRGVLGFALLSGAAWGVVGAADELADLRVPPGNRLEKLRGDRAGQHSIRVNDQWRICFRWKDGDAFDVEIGGYH